MKRPSERLILGLGLVIAAVTLVDWTTLGYARFDAWSPEGLYRAVGVLGAVLLLVMILRFAYWFTEEGPH